ncbi:hypothetical protein, partial [Pseudomonas sp. R62]|uniref:hypothetical protein n=1 Tax=Pseudomonas sp. R62 TaxID=1144884 RepID=UPI001EE65F19
MPYKDGAFGQAQRQGASCKRQEQAKALVANGYAHNRGLNNETCGSWLASDSGGSADIYVTDMP